METVQKVAKGAQKQGPVLPIFKSDATKVQSKGMGLKKAYLNKHNQFTVHAGDAGKSILMLVILNATVNLLIYFVKPLDLNYNIYSKQEAEGLV